MLLTDAKRLYVGTQRVQAAYLGGQRLAHLRTNMFFYPNAEAGGVTGWGTYRGATITSSAEQAHSGSRSYKVTTPGTQQTEGINQGSTAAMSPGHTGPVTISAWVLAPAGAGMRLGFEEYSSTGTYVGLRGSANFTGTGAWQRVSVTASVASASSVPRLYVRTFGDPAAITFYVDDVLTESGSEVLPYFDGSTPRAEWTGAPHSSASTLLTRG